MKNMLKLTGREITKEEALNIVKDTEEEGLIQRFEYTFELAWKCLQDLLQERGYGDTRGPRPVIEQAFQDGIISESDTLYGVSMNEDGISQVVSLKV